MKKKLAMGTLFVVAFLVNPQLIGCSSDAEDFTYSEADMRDTVVGEWQGTAELEGESIPFTLTLKQAPRTPAAHDQVAPPIRPQCGSRTFVQPAAACMSMSTMALAGTLTSDSPRLSGAVTGSAMAYRTLDSTELELELSDALRFNGNVARQTVADGGLFGDGGAALGSFTLTRP